MPFYNVADYIADCLESLRRQTLDDLEVVLVNDGSEDASDEIANKYCRTDPRFRLVRQENHGLGPARNTGAEVSEGEYIAFVDSDDIVPRHAYEMLVLSLDESGSSLAAGNARRFDDFSVWNSWLHRPIFTERRQATHVLEFNQLALDRMVWNKVFRRSFWDEYGYAFPAIRYEDYPVTLKAYLDAVTVDCLSQPIYYWRERTSGDSITQRKNEYANARDRVASAEMVLDIVEKQPSYLRRVVHQHLAQIDLATLVDFFNEVSDNEATRLAEISKSFAVRLHPNAAAASSPLGRVQHHALRSGDVDLLRMLAKIRRGGALGTTRATRTAVPWRRHQLVLPGMQEHARSMRKKLFRLPRKALYITTTVSDVVWQGSTLVVRGTAEIRNLRINGESRLDVVLDRNGTEVALPVERFPAYDSHGDQSLVGFAAQIPPELLAGIAATDEPAQLRVTITQGNLRRSGLLRNIGPGNPSIPPGAWLGESDWLQPLPTPDNRLVLKQVTAPARLTSAILGDGVLVLEGVLPTGAEELGLTRVWDSEKIAECQVSHEPTGDRFVARITLPSLVNSYDPEDPVLRRTVRRLEAGDEEHPVLATGLTRAVGQVWDGRLIQVSRAADNAVVIIDAPAQPIADELGVAEGLRQVTVAGQTWGALGFPLVWRRIGGNTSQNDVECLVAIGERWTATVDVDLLLARSSLEVRTTPATWQLIGLPPGRRPYSIQPDAFLASEPSITVLVRDRQLALRSRADRVTIEVR